MRLLGTILAEIALVIVTLLVICIVIFLLGCACWIALSIWKTVFTFFM